MNLSDFIERFTGDATFEQLGLARTLVNLAAVLVLSQVLSWHYVRFSQVLSNKRKFARVFVFIATTTMLVISVVQTSLALSLGLVGALSIIRFRTPIKEPEELAYLFLAVAIGVGAGAGQAIVTGAIVAIILLYLAVAGWNRSAADAPRVLMHVSCEFGKESGSNSDEVLQRLLKEVEGAAGRVDLRRVDAETSGLHVDLILDALEPKRIGGVLHRIQEALPGSTVSVVEASSLS